MKKNSHKRRIISVSIQAICFLSVLVFTEYYALSEVDCFSSNLIYENQDLPTVSNIGKSKSNLKSADIDLYLPALGFPGLIPYLRAPIPLDVKINDGLRC
jgi:hypothetical protein